LTRQALTYFEIDLPVCVRTYASSPCAAVLGFLGASGELAADFDGTNDYMLRGAGLTGAADSKLVTGSFWFVADSTTNTIFSNTGVTFDISFSANKINIVAENAGGTQILNVLSSALSTGVLYHCAFSFDLSSTSKRHLYINGVSDLATVTTYTNDTIDFTVANWSVGALVGSTQKFNGRLGQFWFSPGTYINLSVERNMRKFRTEGGRPVDLGSTGATPTEAQPIVFLSTTTPASDYQTNRGSGGNFTVTGALTTLTAYAD
jgi:hypothetical protein